MNNTNARNRAAVEKYRKKIFRSKEECRRIFAGEPFEKKIRIAFDLYERDKLIKKFKPF